MSISRVYSYIDATVKIFAEGGKHFYWFQTSFSCSFRKKKLSESFQVLKNHPAKLTVHTTLVQTTPSPRQTIGYVIAYYEESREDATSSHGENTTSCRNNVFAGRSAAAHVEYNIHGVSRAVRRLARTASRVRLIPVTNIRRQRRFIVI